MEPVIIALICAASFGVVVAISVFVRQLLLSRDKNLNDEAQRKALILETAELEKMRNQMQSNKRFDSHYKVLGVNKDAIMYLDNKIEDILHKKAQLVERYAQVTLKESGAIVDGGTSLERKEACDKLRMEVEEEIKFYNSELENFQKRRASLWDSHAELQDYLLEQEQSRNESLDLIYKQHSGLLEKIYLRHADEREHFNEKTIDAGTSSFKTILMAPIQFLMRYFNLSTGVSIEQVQIEKNARDDIEKAEKDINADVSADEESLNEDADENKEDLSEEQEEDFKITFV